MWCEVCFGFRRAFLETTYETDSERVSVVPTSMSAGFVIRSALLNGSVASNDVVVANVSEAPLHMPLPNLFDADVHIRGSCCAVNYQPVD